MNNVIIIGAAIISLTTGPAFANCPERISPSYGASLSSIARACGINVEALKQANPGLNDSTLLIGKPINIPQPVMRDHSQSNSRVISPQLLPPTGINSRSTNIPSPIIGRPAQPMPLPNTGTGQSQPFQTINPFSPLQ